MRRPDAIDEYNSVLGRLEEGWGRGFWNELTGFREEHPNWGGWAMPVLRNDQFNYNGEFELVKLFVFGVCFINKVPFVRGMRPRVGRGPVSSWSSCAPR